MALFPPGQALAEQLQTAVRALNNHAPDVAIEILLPLSQWKPSAEVFFLLATARRMRGELAEAEDLFRRSLAQNPKQAHVHTALGQLLRTRCRSQEAAQSFRQAVRLSRSDVEAHLGLAEALRDCAEGGGAARAYREVLRLQPGNLAARHGLGVVLNGTGRPEEAETILRPALVEAVDPKQKAAVEHALGVSAMLQNRLEEALASFETTQRLDPEYPRICLDQAVILQRLYRDEEAIILLKALVEREPLNLEGHKELNKLLYCLRRDDEFLKSYDSAAARRPDRPGPSLAKARFLLAAERFSEAREIFAAAQKADPTNKNATNGLLVALSHLEEFEAAVTTGAAAMRLFPDDIDVRASTAAAFLRLGDATRAESLIADTLTLDPHSQICLALRGLAWRMQGDARDEVLTDYETHIKAYDLEPPNGYADMQSFNADLDAALDRLHPGRREYVDQSLRNGSQTTDNIFNMGHELVERLRIRIAEAVQTYIANMPVDPIHPFYGRRQRSFDFAGSWSSRLRDKGFHTSHIHAQGWISSCYYVSLPDAVADAEGRQGWIEFGRPTFKLDLKELVRRSVQPRAGQLLLFPSYMLHGTVPFHSAQTRTTIAFDVVPR